jgi:predicted nuclease with TOPRIM domain
MKIDMEKVDLMTEIDSLRRGWQAAEKQLEETRAESARLREALEALKDRFTGLFDAYARKTYSGDADKDLALSLFDTNAALSSTPTTAEWMEERDQEVKASVLEEVSESVKSLMTTGPSAYAVARNTGIADSYILIAKEASTLRNGEENQNA